MSAFNDYYLPDVEGWLGRHISIDERLTAYACYMEGWRPRNTADGFHKKDIEQKLGRLGVEFNELLDEALLLNVDDSRVVIGKMKSFLFDFFNKVQDKYHEKNIREDES